MPFEAPPAAPKQERFSAIPIPRGWTLLQHGTNMAQWPSGDPTRMDEIVLTSDLSVIERQRWLDDRRDHGSRYDTTAGYASKGDATAQPLEIRVVFYQNHPQSTADPEYKKSLSPETMAMIAKYYF